MDEKWLYCGKCRVSQPYNFHPTPFQQRAIEALRSNAPETHLQQVVAQERLALASWNMIQILLLELHKARRVPPEQHDALTSVCQRVMEIRDALR